MIVEAYDVGGTWTRGALISQEGMLIRIQERTTENFVRQIKSLSERLRMDATPDIVSVAVPGPVKDGILLSAPPLKRKTPINIAEELSGLEREIIVENDLNAAVLAELHLGYGRKWQNFYLLTLSTGIGAGIVLHGQTVKGGEFGHCYIRGSLDNEQRLCDCGKRGCWSAYASGRGVERITAEELKGATVETIFSIPRDKSRRRNRIAEEIRASVRSANAQGLALMINAIDIEGIVVMGALGLKHFAKVIPDKEQIERYAINPIPEIVKTKLGDNIGLLGAYYIATQKA